MRSPDAPSLEGIAQLCLQAGHILLESGANGRTVSQSIESLARGLGCTSVETYCQHSAIIVMLQRGTESFTHMGKVGEHGVNLRGGEVVLKVVDRIAHGTIHYADAQAQIKAATDAIHKYPLWLVCLATGLACGAFGRLLGLDWASFVPVCLGAAFGQWLRVTMLHRSINFYLMVTTVSFAAAIIAGGGVRLLGGASLEIATISATLLLIPGPAMLNCQIDALDGKPNLAVARAFRVAQIVLFLTLGLVAAQRLIGA